MPVVMGGNAQGVSCFDRLKTGFIMGGCVGIAAGVIFGGYGGLRAGLRGRELINEAAKTMCQTALTFGVFMSVGSVIRC